MNIEIVNIVYVDAVWTHVGPKLQKAIDICGDDYTVSDLWQMCRSGAAFLIIAREGDQVLMGSIVRFERWSSGTVLRVVGLAGSKMSEWASDWQEFMENMARDGGADRIISEGREGWQRVFKKARKMRVVYEMRV